MRPTNFPSCVENLLLVAERWPGGFREELEISNGKSTDTERLLTFDDYSHFNSQCGSWIYIHSIIEIDISCNLAAYYNASLVIIELIIKNVFIACAKKWNSKWADINQF